MQSHLNSQWGSGPHYDFNCYEGTCDDEHEACTPEAEGLEQLRTALATADVVAAAAVIAEHEGTVAVNAARSAVQVSNCSGEVVAHLPISNAFARKVQTVLKASDSYE
jgi:hypothetical protein